MRKLIIPVILIVSLLMSVCNVFAAAAGPKVLEVPDIKIIMEGTATTYKNVPISINGSTLLPLRELLVNLGVPNDDVVWNGSEKSVTVSKDDTRLYLQIGSNTAKVNDKSIQLNAAPIIYKSTTYIPLRFVSDALGKKVVWDNSSRSVLIRDAAEYARIKDILEKTDAAMAQISTCKFNVDVNAVIGEGQNKKNVAYDITAELDNANKALHMLMKINAFGFNLNSDTYFSDNTSYTYSPLDGTWAKKTYTPEEYAKAFAQQGDMDILKGSETLYAGLVASQSADTGETTLEGDVCLGDLLNKAMSQASSLIGNDKITFQKYHLVTVIDNATNLVKSIKMNLVGTDTTATAQAGVTLDVNAAYTDYNGDVKITIPADVLQKAIESPSKGT